MREATTRPTSPADVLRSADATSLLTSAEQDDKWQRGRRYFRPEIMALIHGTAEPEEVRPPF